MAPEPILLQLKNVEAAYGPITAIRGVSLAVPRGAIVTVLGANGAGKTTIMKTISGILDPSKGTIEFEGEPYVVRRDVVNLGLAVDMEKEDGSRSLLVPNIKGAGGMDFAQFSIYAARPELWRLVDVRS